MTLRDRAIFVFLVWLCVCPGLLVTSYGARWIGLDLPLWLQVILSTLFTVPLSSIVAKPAIERVVARLKHETLAELKLDQARRASDTHAHFVRDEAE